MGGADRREDRSRPWEEPDLPLTRTPTSPTTSSSSTSRPCPRFLPRRRAAPPLYTDACPTTRGHRGEDDLFPPLVGAPAFELRWNAPLLRAAAGDAGLRARLGQYVCRCHCLHQRAPLSSPSLSLSLIEHRVLLHASAAPRRAVSRSHSRASPRGPDAPCHHARQHARVSIPGARLDLGPFPLA
jgi:hypothetical protein